MLSNAKNIKKIFSADIKFNVFLLLLSLFLLWQAAEYPRMARNFPQLILSAVIFLLVADFIVKATGIFKTEKKLNQAEVPMDPPAVSANSDDGLTETLRPDMKIVSLTIFLMFCYVALIFIVGFTVGTLIFIPISAWLLGFKDLKLLILSTVFITAFMHLIFIVVMNSILPTGLLIEYLFGI